MYSLAAETLRTLIDSEGVLLPTPAMIFDAVRLEDTIAALQKTLPGADLRYAIKANRDHRLLRLLARHGIGMALWTRKDLDALVASGLDDTPTLMMDPRIHTAFALASLRYGVRLFTVDYITWIEKVAAWAPYAEVLIRVRLTHPSSGLAFPYRYGTAVERFGHLWRWASDIGLQPRGLSVHLGSQLQDPAAWERVCSLIARLGPLLPEGSILNLGGGLPVPYAEGGSHWLEHLQSIRQMILDDCGKSFQLMLEPGRSLVAEAGTLITRIVKVGQQGNRRVLTLDTGSSGGLGEAPLGIHHPLVGPSPASDLVPTLVAGPGGILADPLASALLPRALGVGDWLGFANAGAYSTALIYDRRGAVSVATRWIAD